MRWPWNDDDHPPGPTLVLVRHGRTAWNAERRFLGITDRPLDEVGESEVAALGAALGGRFDHVYTSPLARALQTAHALHSSPEPIEALRELNQGALEGLRLQEAVGRFPSFFQAWLDDPESATPPEGERLSACRDRALAAVEGIAARHGPDEVVAVVTHQLVIASLTCVARGESLRGWRSHGVGNTGATTLRRTADGWTVLAEGWLPHDLLGPARADV